MIEVAVDTLESALSARRAGAGRIELCASLHDAGITPSAGLIAAVSAGVDLPVVALIRPRGGDFVYGDHELGVMRHDIELAATLGAGGFASGALRPDYTIDMPATKKLVAAAGDRPLTFHRAFDFTGDLFIALDQLIDCGVKRVLTSGGAPIALDGVETIARLVQRADGRITIIAGGGIRENNVREIIDRTGVTELHARVTSTSRAANPTGGRVISLRKPFPTGEMDHEEIDEQRIRQLVDLAVQR